jgi:hypothetical protein
MILTATTNARNPYIVAKTLASQGLAVFPVRAKQPLTSRGVYSATTDLNALARMDGWRNADGCGLATGKVSGVDVLDVDVRDTEAALNVSRNAEQLAEAIDEPKDKLDVQGLAERIKAKRNAEPQEQEQAKSAEAPAVITARAPSLLIAGFENVPDAPKAPTNATEQERLTYPPSRLLGAAVAHAYGCTTVPNRQLALWGALVGMVKILDRRAIGPTGSSTVLFNLLLAASGAGKEDAIQFVCLLLATVDYLSLYQAGMVTSVQAVEDLVVRTPNCLVMIDEFGRFFKMIQDQSGNVSQLPGVFCKLWGQKPTGVYGTMQRARQNADSETQIHWPTFALAAASVSDPFWQATGDDHIAGGFLNRCFLYNAGIGATEIVKPTHDPERLEPWMVKAMKLITRGLTPMQGTRPLLNGDLGPWRLVWGPKAQEAYLDHANDIRKLAEGRKRDLFIRAPELAVRAASVAAIWDGTTELRLDHFEWAWDHTDHSCKMLLAGANENMQVKRDFAEDCRHIKRLLSDGPTRWMDIRSKSRSAAGQYGMEILDKAIAELIDCGEVREIFHKEQIERQLRAPVGAPGRWFELAGN